MADEGVSELRCPKCGRRLSLKVQWFSNAQNSEVAIGRCFYHGYVQGKIRFRNTEGSDDTVYAIKKITRTNKAGFEGLKARQEELREKKRLKRHESEKRKSKARRARKRRKTPTKKSAS